jgi:hypothetical protein
VSAHGEFRRACNGVAQCFSGRYRVSPWLVAGVTSWWRLRLLDSNPGWGGLLVSVERCFEFCRRVEAEPSSTNSAAIGDFDENGTLDVFFANYRTPNRMCLGDGTGGFECTDVSAPDNPSTSADVGDVNGDGHLDVLLGQHEPGLARETYADQICLGDGTGALDCSRIPSPRDASFSGTDEVLLADVNNDGNLDYFSMGAPFDLLCLGDGDGGFECLPQLLEVRDERGFAVPGGFSGIAIIEPEPFRSGT